MVCCARRRTLLVVGLCMSPISARCRSLYSSSATSLTRHRSLYSLAAMSPVVAEIWSDFGFCGVVFESLVVDAIVFLGFVVNLWVSVDYWFWVLWMLLFFGFVNLRGSPLFFFFFFSNGGGWDGHGFAGLRWKCEFVGQIGGYGWLVFFSGGGGWDGYGFAALRWSSLLGWEWQRGRERDICNWRIKKE